MALTLCDDCNAAGLPILPVRYVPVPTAITPALPSWAGGDRIASVGIGPEFHYALRTLRQGYVYVFYAKNHGGANLWECWAVTEDGHLLKQPDPLMAPTRPPASVMCARQGHSNARLRHIVIQRPDKCGPTWIAFSPHKWSEETLKEYTGNSKLRNARMQTLHPAQMATGAKHAHGAVAWPAALEQVIEYAAGTPKAALPYEAATGAFSTPDGRFDARALTKVSTLYPWHLRQGQAQADVQAMVERAKKPSGSHTPHLLALWDAIGTAHELNGYRNDAAGWLDLYRREREKELQAANTIDGLHDALTARAVDAQKAEQDQRMQNAGNWHDPALAAQRRANAERMAEPQRSRELQVCTILDDWASRQVPQLGYHSRLQQANAQPEPGRSAEIAALKTEVDQFTLRRARNQQANTEHARAHAWPKYEDRLLRPALDDFNRHVKSLHAQSDRLIDQRTMAVVAWLEAPLFIDTLEHFHTTNIHDGVLFEDAVGDAAFGNGAAASGSRKIDECVKQSKSDVKTNSRRSRGAPLAGTRRTGSRDQSGPQMDALRSTGRESVPCFGSPRFKRHRPDQKFEQASDRARRRRVRQVVLSPSTYPGAPTGR